MHNGDIEDYWDDADLERGWYVPDADDADEPLDLYGGDADVMYDG